MAEKFNHNKFLTRQQVRFVRQAFKKLGLPMPVGDECFETSERGFIVFINPAGCTVRIDQKELVELFRFGDRGDDDRIIQPLGRIRGHGIVISVYPGVIVPELHGADDLKKTTAWDYEAEDFAQEFSGTRYQFWDDHGANIGRLPKTQTKENPQGFTVVLDPGALKLRSESYIRFHRRIKKLEDWLVRWHLMLPASTRGKTNEQARLYRDLRASFGRAAGHGWKGIGEFWRGCIGAAREGRLVADWRNVAADNKFYSDISAKAAAYEKRLASCRAFPQFTA